MPPFRVEFTITADDVVAYIRLAQRTLNRIGVVLGLVAMSIGGVLAIVTSDAFTGVWTFGIGLLFVILAGTEFLDRWRVNRGARSLIGTTAKFTIDDSGINADSVTGTGRAPWSAATDLKTSDRMLLIKRDRIAIAWIPTRAFSSPDEVTAVRSFIASHIGRG